jgi:hypothetical protein
MIHLFDFSEANVFTTNNSTKAIKHKGFRLFCLGQQIFILTGRINHFILYRTRAIRH